MTSLKETPSENAAKIARLNKIQDELENRKQTIKSLEEKKIGKRIEEEEYRLGEIRQQMKEVNKQWEQAKQKGELNKADEIQQYFFNLQKKQAVITAMIDSLKNCDELQAFANFEDIEDLYNGSNEPEVIVSIGEPEITFENFNTKKFDTNKFLFTILVLSACSYLIYLSYCFFIKEDSDKQENN